jgi:hypothetical protein
MVEIIKTKATIFVIPEITSFTVSVI